MTSTSQERHSKDQQVFAWQEARSTVTGPRWGGSLSLHHACLFQTFKARRYEIWDLYTAAPQNNTRVKHHHTLSVHVSYFILFISTFTCWYFPRPLSVSVLYTVRGEGRKASLTSASHTAQHCYCCIAAAAAAASFLFPSTYPQTHNRLVIANAPGVVVARCLTPFALSLRWSSSSSRSRVKYHLASTLCLMVSTSPNTTP